MIGTDSSAVPKLPGDAGFDRLDLDAVPGPKQSLWAGQFGNIVGYLRDPVGYMDKLAHGGYGNVVIFARGMRRGVVAPPKQCPGTVFMAGADLLQRVMTKHDSPYPGQLPPETGEAARLTQGVAWLEGATHRKHRRMLNPIYHLRQVQHYRDAFVEVAGKHLGRLQPGQRVGVVGATGDMLLEFQNELVLGVGGMSGEMGRIAQEMLAAFELMIQPAANIPLDLPLTPRRRLIQRAAHVTGLLKRLIAVKREAAEPASDVVSMMAFSRDDNGEQLTPDEIVAEMLMAFIGGWISTRAAFASTMFLIAQHPPVAAALHDELCTVLGGEAPTFEQLAELPMLDHVVKETLRLLPPIPYVPRTLVDNDDFAGYRLPAGTEVLLSIYHTHRDPQVFAQPQRFLPERWRSIKPTPTQYQPFGFGRRVCVGMALANMQLRIMVAMAVQRFRFQVPSDAKIQYGGLGVIAPKPDMELWVHAQDRRFDESAAPVRGNVTTMVDLPACAG